MRYVVLGGGMQGRVIAANLAGRKDTTDVRVVDVRPVDGLVDKAAAVNADALDRDAVRAAAKGADCIVVALPGSLGKRALANALQVGAPVVDVSFSAETLRDLEDDARRSGACAIADCGVAPGLSHVLAGSAHARLGGLDRLVIRVGGIPLDPPPYFRHAVYFNAEDLLDEYIRPARLRAKGRFEAPHPLDAPVERFDDLEMGAFEAFPSDGLRSLVTTSFPDVPDMVELTLRREGHLEFMRGLRAAGFLDSHMVVPGEEPATRSTARVLAHRYAGDKFPDFLLMTVEGTRGDKRMGWRLLDRARDGVSAMSRTTAYTAAAIANLLAHRRFAEPGLHMPEVLGRDTRLVDALVGDLQERDVRLSTLT